MSLVPAGMVARRVQETLVSHRASLLTTVVRRLIVARMWGTAVRGLAVFAAATLTRSRRHAVILASYAGLAIAMAVVELLTAGFMEHFSVAAPRRDNLAVPLVCLFFAVIGLRTALARPADPAANWPFRIASPRVRDSRRAARLVVMLCGVAPIIFGTLLTALAVWPPGIALRVVALDTAAALLLLELAFASWTKAPCASVHASATESVKSTWPLQVLGLYLFAFRGADIEMLALNHAHGVEVAVAAMFAIIIGMRMRQAASPDLKLTLDPVSDDGLLILRLSEGDV
jgi:hypothetical protein